MQTLNQVDVFTVFSQRYSNCRGIDNIHLMGTGCGMYKFALYY